MAIIKSTQGKKLLCDSFPNATAAASDQRHLASKESRLEHGHGQLKEQISYKKSSLKLVYHLAYVFLTL